VTIPANLNAWKTNDKTGGAAPTDYELTALPVDIYLEGKTASSDILDTEIKAEMTLNSGVKCRDSIKYTVVQVDFVRFWDNNKTANRSTRAYAEYLRVQRAFEDNARSIFDAIDSEPMIVLSGTGSQMSTAEVKLYCKFYPEAAGEIISWKVIGGNHQDWVTDPKEGDFSQNPTNIIFNLPSSGNFETHCGADAIIEVGMGEDRRILIIELGLRVIPKPEFDYIASQVWWWLANFGWIVLPHTCEYVDIFFHDNLLPTYASEQQKVFSCYSYPWEEDLPNYKEGYSYIQMNSSGCDQIDENNYTQYYTKEYTWNTLCAIEYKIVKSPIFWDDVMLPAIQSMNIGDWYVSNPGETQKEFQQNIDTNIIFNEDDDTDEQDLSLSLHGCRADMLLVAFTEKQTSGEIIITKLRIIDGVFDFYNWGNNCSSNWEGLISRVQTCYGTSGTDKGNIFMAYYDLTSDVTLYEPVEYNNYDLIRTTWLLSWPLPLP